MKKTILFFVLLAVSVNLAQAQIYIDKGFNEDRLQFRVKQLDEFVKRFNHEIDIEGNKVTKADLNTRRLYILSLFDENLMTGELDKKDLQKFDDFIITSANDSNSIKLSFYDNNWYAEAECKAKFKGKSENLKLILKTETDSKHNSHWIIVSAYAEFLSISPSEINENLFLSPVDNEMNFMSLPSITETDKKNIINYAAENYKPNYADIFFYLVKTGQLEVQYVENIIYHFLQVPNFIFTVQHFERDSDNVGWLISNFKRANNSEKEEYKKQKLFLPIN